MTTTIYSARWVLPVVSTPVAEGAVAIEGAIIVGVGSKSEIISRFPTASVKNFPESAIIPGLINSHTHLELTVMRGYLEVEESDFFAWLRKLTIARVELMNPDDLYVSAAWGACEAVRAGITSVGDASDSGSTSMRALKDVGLRAIVFQESFGPDVRLAQENFEKLKIKIAELKESESSLVKVGVSPHSPYTVCGKQLEMIAGYAQSENLPLMIHAAESAAEEELIRHGCGMFADGLARRDIKWLAPGVSPIQYLNERNVLETSPLLAHCIRVDDSDIETLAQTRSKVAHCPKSNAKLGHGRAPLVKFLRRGLPVGLGSDSVASNNTCDILEEARFAALVARIDGRLETKDVLAMAAIGGAHCLGMVGTIGELTEGAQADLAILSMAGTHQLPSYDPTVSTIFSSSGRDVVLTVVAGKEVFRDGHVVDVDEERLGARIQEIAKKLNQSDPNNH